MLFCKEQVSQVSALSEPSSDVAGSAEMCRLVPSTSSLSVSLFREVQVVLVTGVPK